MLIPDLSLRPELVRIAGFEPARPKSADFKSAVSTNFTIPALFFAYYLSHYTPYARESVGAQGETRTRKTLFLRQVSIPIPSPGHIYFYELRLL